MVHQRSPQDPYLEFYFSMKLHLQFQHHKSYPYQCFLNRNVSVKWLHSLKPTVRPWKLAGPQKESSSSSNHPFSSASCWFQEGNVAIIFLKGGCEGLIIMYHYCITSSIAESYEPHNSNFRRTPALQILPKNYWDLWDGCCLRHMGGKMDDISVVVGVVVKIWMSSHRHRRVGSTAASHRVVVVARWR